MRRSQENDLRNFPDTRNDRFKLMRLIKVNEYVQENKKNIEKLGKDEKAGEKFSQQSVWSREHEGEGLRNFIKSKGIKLKKRSRIEREEESYELNSPQNLQQQTMDNRQKQTFSPRGQLQVSRR